MFRFKIKKAGAAAVALMVFCAAFVFSSDFNSAEKRRKYMNSFYAVEIPDDVFAFMQGKSFKWNCTVKKENLRYLHVLYTGFDDKSHEGELVCHRAIADDLLEIFRVLYSNKYQIEKICLVDNYNAVDENSMRDNNSSCFNFRFISFTKKVSKHGLGVAVDINPLYNPYVKKVNGKTNVEPATATPYTDRSKNFAHKITEEDLCCRLFAEHGFEWGGSWTSCKDYQHFELPDWRIKELCIE